MTLVTPTAQAAGTGTIAGTVISSSGAPVEGVAVYISTFDDETGDGYYNETYTNGLGQFGLSGLPIGDYLVGTDGADGDIGTYFPGTAEYSEATPVTVGESATTTANIQLVKGASISGTVTTPGGQPANGGYAVAYLLYEDDCADCYYDVDYADIEDGSYELRSLSGGTYRVGFEFGDYLPEYYDSVRTLAMATDIELAPGGTVTEIDAQLDVGGTISGVVRDNHGDPLADAYVYVETASGDFYRGKETNENGEYEIRGLPSGTYTATAYDDYGRHTVETRTGISVTSPQTTSGVDFELTELARITGTVRDSSGDLVPSGYLDIYRKETAPGGAVSYEYYDDAYGSISEGSFDVFTEPGTYRLRAVGFDEFYDNQIDAPTFFGDVSTLSAAADIVVAEAGQTVAGKDIQLLAAARLGGTVSVPSADPDDYTYVPIEIVDATSGEIIEYTGADEGTYEVNNLAAGTYKVQFGRASGFSDLAAQYYDDVAEGSGLPAATAVTLDAGDENLGVDATMHLGSLLTGQVLRSDGSPAAGCRVQAFTPSEILTSRSAITEEDGTFSIPGMSAGAYNVVVNSPLTFDPNDQRLFECVGLPVSDDVAPGPGYYSAVDGTLSASDASLRSVQVAGTGSTAMPVVLKFPGEALPDITSSGTPTITGTPRVGATLTAGGVTWTPADVAVAYQWQAGGSNVGTNQSTYVPTAGDIGKTITVQMSASKTGFTGKSVQSAATAAVVTNVVVNTALPTIPAGAPTVGESISSTPGTWDPADVTLAYQWTAGGVNIANATSSSYTPVAADTGKALAVKVTGSKSGYVATTVTSNSTAVTVAAPVPLTNTKLPSVSGTPQVGKVVQAGGGNWTGGPTGYAFQWFSNDTPIAGATNQKYTVPPADAGKRLSVQVTASREGAAPVTATSSKSVVVAKGVLALTGKAAVKGKAKVGKKLTAKPQSCAPKAAVSYQWLRGKKAIKGAKKAKYKVVKKDKGKKLYVRITYKSSGYTTVVKKVAVKKKIS